MLPRRVAAAVPTSMRADGRSVYNSLQPGDYVLIEFGHNDICSLTDKKMRGSIPCAKDTCNVYQMQESKQFEVVYSFGWYLKKFIQDVYEKRCSSYFGFPDSSQ